jgi:hypothetical protein
MKKPAKLAKTNPATSSVPSSAARDRFSQKISFSFHFLNFNHDKFTIEGKGFHYFQTLMDKLKNISGMEKKSYLQIEVKHYVTTP